MTALAAYNLTDRRDFGEHDNEEGGGPGVGVAGRWYLNERYDGWHVGVRTDLWFLEIDWQDDVGPRTGTTDIVVFQPTAQAGYSQSAAGGRLLFEATLSLGLEVNIDTSGEDVGQGAILLGGLRTAFR